MGLSAAFLRARPRRLQARPCLWLCACNLVVVVHDLGCCRQEHHEFRSDLPAAGDGLHPSAIRDCRAAYCARSSKLRWRDEMPKYVIAYLGGKQVPNPQDRAAHMARWKAWVNGLGSAMVNPGIPLGQGKL